MLTYRLKVLHLFFGFVSYFKVYFMGTNIVFTPKAFYRKIEVRTKIGGEVIETLFWENMRFDFVCKWEWYFRYRSALLQIKYPKYKVNLIMYSHDPVGLTKEQIDNNLRKKRITTCKRMITRISNAILEYETEQEQTLLPNWENESYLKAKSKLSNYKAELETLI